MRNEKRSPPLPSSKKLSLADLTIRDIWILVKYGVTVVIVCAFVFILPYVILRFSSESLLSGSMARWISVLIWVVIVFLIVSNLSDVLTYLSDLLAKLGRAAKGISFAKRFIMFLLLCLYFLLWQNYPEAMFFFSTIILVPAGLIYDKYKALLNEKL